MSRYFLSLKPLSTGKYVLHRVGCPVVMPGEPGIELGSFKDPGMAVAESRKYFRKVGLCPFCLKKFYKERAECARSEVQECSWPSAGVADLMPLWDSFMMSGVN